VASHCITLSICICSPMCSFFVLVVIYINLGRLPFHPPSGLRTIISPQGIRRRLRFGHNIHHLVKDPHFLSLSFTPRNLCRILFVQGAIQNIRDTLGGGVDKVSHDPLLIFKTLFSMVFELKGLGWEQKYFLSNTFHSWRHRRAFKKQWFKT